MPTKRHANDFEIAPGFWASEWNALELDPVTLSDSWSRAADALRQRIEQRFLNPADKLIESEDRHPRKTFGFAILALDCLVIETIQGFRDGIEDHKGRSEALFTGFLQ